MRNHEKPPKDAMKDTTLNPLLRRKGWAECSECHSLFKQKRHWQKFCKPKCRRAKWEMEVGEPRATQKMRVRQRKLRARDRREPFGRYELRGMRRGSR